MKQNDWIVASINNPDFTAGDFRTIGLSLDNTQLLSRDEYLKSDYIKNNDLFKDDNDQFSKDKFNDFYNQKVQDFNTFKNTDDQFAFDLFDYTRYDNPEETKVKDTGFNLFRISNPTEFTIGYGGINQQTASPFSIRELAQKNKIFDFESQKEKDYSPNDVALTSNPKQFFKELFSNPLVLAVYEEDGEHTDPISGQIVKHKKGDYKLNSEGKTYYETLSGRSLAGKDVLSMSDILTTDGTKINKYDIFDSDGLDKNPGKVILDTAVKVAPLFIGGPVSTIYAGWQITRELTKVMPMLDGLVSTFSGTNEDTTFSKLANNAAGWGTKMSRSTSDKARVKSMSLENIATMMSDVALQWGQQKLVAKAFHKLKGTDKLMESAEQTAKANWLRDKGKFEADLLKQGLPEEEIAKAIGTEETWKTSVLGASYLSNATREIQPLIQKANRLGADMALGYMALISNPDVYQSMLEHGATKRDATVVTLGSTVGMFLVDRQLGLGEMFFDELTPEGERAMRAHFKQEAKKWTAELQQKGEQETLSKGQKLRHLFESAKNKSMKVYSDFWEDVRYHSGNMLGKAIGEGLEEVSEEVVADLSKQIYEWAGEISPNFINQSGITNVDAFSNVWDDPKRIIELIGRYGMNFLGGFFGGGIFYGKEVLSRPGGFKVDHTQDELIYLIRNNRVQDVLNELKKFRKKGKLGSTKLSYRFDENTGTFYTAKDQNDTQNEFIYNRMKDSILNVAAIIKEYDLNKSDDELYKTLTFNEQRFQQLKDYLQNAAFETGYFETYQDITKKVLQARQTLNDLDKSSDEEKRNNDWQQKVQKATQELQAAQQELQDFYDGRTSLEYLRKTLFFLDKRLSEHFMIGTFKTWLQKVKNADFNSLTEDKLSEYRIEYNTWLQNNGKLQGQQAWEQYKELTKAIAPNLVGIQEQMKEYRKWTENITELFNEDPFAFEKVNPEDNFDGKLTFDSFLMQKTADGEAYLEDETSDSYIYRNNKITPEETDESLQLRIEQRNKLVESQNIEKAAIENKNRLMKKIHDVIDALDRAGDFIDSTTRRKIYLRLNKRRQDVIDQYLKQFKSSILDDRDISSILSRLEPDLSNWDEVVESTIKSKLEQIQKNTPDILEHKGIINHFINKNDEKRELTKDDLNNFLASIGGNIETLKTLVDDIYSQENMTSTRNKELLADLIDELISIVQNDESLDEWNSFNGENIEDLLFLESVENEEGIDVDKITPTEKYETLKNELLLEQETQVKNAIGKIKLNIERDQVYKFLQQIEDKSNRSNPIIDLVKNLQLNIQGRTDENIESLLQKLYDRLSKGRNDDFQLTSSEKDQLDDAELLLDLASSLIWATWNSENYKNPFGHNVLINKVAKDNGVKDFEELPVINDDTASLYMTQLQAYLNEIGQVDENGNYNVGSWRFWDARNSANKIKQFTNGGVNLWKSRYDLYKNIDLKGTVELKDGSTLKYDLLEGITFDYTDQQIKQAVHTIENQMWINIHNLMNKYNLSFKEILKGLSGLISTFNKDEVSEQTSAILDENIDWKKFTSMDYVVFLTAIAAESSTDFYEQRKNIITETSERVPLSSQELLVRIGKSLSKNPEAKQIFNDALEFLSECGSDNRGRILLKNAVLMTGNGGVGKSYVVAHDLAEEFQEDEVWLSAPGESQLNTLLGTERKSRNVQGVAFTKQKLLEQICDPDFIRVLNSLHNEKDKLEKLNDEYKKYFEITSVNNGSGEKQVVLKKGSIKFNKVIKYPKILILDEVSWYSSLELAAISEFCELNDISLYLLGDNLQNGFDSKNVKNIGQEDVFVLRTGRLVTTLRDANKPKQDNERTLSDALIDLTTSLSAEEVKKPSIVSALIDKYKTITLSYYSDGDTLNGDLIVNTLTREQLLPLKENKSVVFIGNRSSSFYNLVQELIPDVITLEESEVQGREFDYVIADLSFNEKSNQHAQLIDNLRKLYTAITRAREGSIIIDKDNIIKPIINNKRENHKVRVTTFNDAVKSEFKKNYLAFINSLDLTPLKLENEPKKTVQKTNEEESKTLDTNEEEQNQANYGEENQETEIKADKNIEKKVSEIETTEHNDVEIVTTIADFKGEQVLGYSENHILGVPRRKLDEDTDKERYEWDLTGYDSETEPLNDILIFANARQDRIESSKIDDPKIKSLLVEDLLDFKSALEDSQLIWSSDNFPSSVKSIITKEEFENIRYKIVVRPKLETDSFVGFSDLGTSDDLFTISTGKDGTKLAFFIVAEFKNKKGQTCNLTIGMLGDPTKLTEKTKESLLKSADVRKQKLLDILNDPKRTLSEEEKGIIEEAISDIEDYKEGIKNNNQQKFVDNYKDKWNTSDEEIYEEYLDDYDVTFSENTELRNIIRNGEDEVPERRLDSLDDSIILNPDDNDADRSSFIKANKYAVISDVYTYRPSEESDIEALKNLGGQSVVFVSRFKHYRKEDLAQLWIQQQTGKINLTGKYKVRMLRLNHAGVSLNQLSNKTYRDVLQSVDPNNGKTNYFPFETEPMGWRMLISLWNFRANLTKFINEINIALSETGYLNQQGIKSESDLFTFANILHNLRSEYNNIKDKSKPSFKSYIENNSIDDVTKKKVLAIHEFNLSLNDVVKDFRIGGNSLDVPAVIGSLNIPTNQDNPLYNKSQVEKGINGIYINLDKAKQYKINIDYLFDHYINEIYQLQTSDEKNIDITTNLEIDKKQGFITKDGQNIITKILGNTDEEITFDGVNLKLNRDRVISFLPTLIVKLDKQAIAYSKTKEVNGVRVFINPESGLQENWLPRKTIVHYNKDNTDKELVLQQLVEAGIDIDDMLNLCFHGTTQRFVDVKHKPLQATSAYFKNGFYIDSMLSDADNFEVEIKNGTKKIGGFVRTSISPYFFKLKVALDMPKIFIRSKKNTNIKTETEEDLTEQILSQHFIDIFNNSQYGDESINLLTQTTSDDQLYKVLFELINNKLENDELIVDENNLSPAWLRNNFDFSFDNLTKEFTLEHQNVVYSGKLEISDGNLIITDFKRKENSTLSNITDILEKYKGKGIPEDIYNELSKISDKEELIHALNDLCESCSAQDNWDLFDVYSSIQEEISKEC